MEFLRIEQSTPYLVIVAIAYGASAMAALVVLWRYYKMYGDWSKALLFLMIIGNFAKTVVNFGSIGYWDALFQEIVHQVLQTLMIFVFNIVVLKLYGVYQIQQCQNLEYCDLII